jgi:hypothetical protein
LHQRPGKAKPGIVPRSGGVLAASWVGRIGRLPPGRRRPQAHRFRSDQG